MGAASRSHPATHPGRKNMRCTFLVLSLAAFYATASIDDVVPEDSLYAFDDDLSEAQQKINEMTAAGADDKKCRELVKVTRKDVETNVKNCQTIMDGLPDGSDRPNRGQDGVKTATELKSKAYKYYQTTITEVTKASSTSVNFGSRTFSSLTEGKCESFYSSTSYITAESTYNAAVTARTKAKGAYEQTIKDLAIAVDSAAKAKKECLCKTRKDHENAFGKHSAANAANQKAWNFACKLECVLDKKYTSCKCSAAPMCKRAQVTSEVKEVDCTVQKICCKAMTAKCLACTKGMSEADYCSFEGSDKKISGCAPKCNGKELLKFASAKQTGSMNGHDPVKFGPNVAIDGNSNTRQGMLGGSWTGDFGKAVDLRQLRVDW